MIEFANLHAHTNLGSMLDAMCGVDELFDRVKELGQKALAITDHGTLAAHFDAHKAYKRTGVKFIPGCELYFVNSYDFIETDTKRKRTEKRKHLVFLAQNQAGYKNLLKANFIGFQHFVLVMGRVFPRISWDVIENYNEGIICTSACSSGPLSVLIMDNKLKEAENLALRFNEIFDERFYIEIQPHHLKNERIDQREINRGLIRLANKLGIPLTASIDTHYITRESEKYHDTLMAINSKAPVDDPNRHRYGIDEFYVKTGEEVHNFLTKHYGVEVADEAVENTVKIAEMCEPPDYMETEGNHLPIFNPKNEKDYEEFVEWRKTARVPTNLKDDTAFMRFRIVKGFKKKFFHMSAEERRERWNRVINELKVLEGNDFSSYMLVTADYINWARENDILVGPGRGCLSGDTLVLTNNSYKRLDEIKTGDLVYTHKGNLEKVEETFKYNVFDEELIELQTDYSFEPIILTHDHEIYASKAVKTKRYEQFSNNNWKPPFKGKKYEVGERPSWISVSELKAEDFIFMPFPEKIDQDIERFDLSKYVGINDYLQNDIICSKIPLVNDFSIRKISRETGLDRGTVQRAKRNANILDSTKYKISEFLIKYNISIEKWREEENCEIRRIGRFLPCDEDFCYVVGRWIGDGCINDKHSSYSIEFAFNRSDTQGKNRIIGYFENLGFKCLLLPHREKDLDQIYVYGYILAKLFRDLFPEYRDNSSTKYLGLFKDLPKSKLKNVILGLQDSDGYVGTEEDKRECIDSTSKRLIHEVRESLLYLGIPSSVVVREPFYVGKYLCKKSYKIRFRGITNRISSRVASRTTNNGFYVKILNKNKVKRDFVYDIKVENDHSYLTQNFAVHNSVGGSMVAYLLGIHGVDPIEYGLMFERFQNAYKKDLPDIDTDFTSAGRDKVQEYVKQKYGSDHCATVSNINSYTAKSVIPDLVKSMRNVMPGLVPEGTNYVKVSEAIKKAIPEEDTDGKKVKTLERAMELSKDLRKFAERCPELMEYADKIVGMPKEFSTHAAAMVISDVPIIEFAPLRVDKNGDVAVQYEKNRCEALGLIKMDFLAISTLDVIDETIKNIKRLGIDGPKNMEDIPMGDQETYKMIQNGHTKCVFQLGKSGMMVTLCKKIKPRNILDIAMVNALGRPSSSKEERQDYVERRFGRKKVSYLHPSLENSLKSTYGLCVMEEQLMGVAQDVAGWDLNKADGLRKLTKLKGKDPKLALQLEVDFIEGMMKKHNVDYEFAKDTWNHIVASFGNYGFNKSHAVFYSINGYITAYLKCHYPAAFLAAYLKVKTARGGVSKDEEVAIAKEECRRMGVKIIPPDINNSTASYEVLDENSIVMGFAAIKGLGEKAVSEVVGKQPYANFAEFLYKTEGRVINKTRTEVLAKAGCFDSFNISRKGVHDMAKKNRDKMTAFIRNKTKDGYGNNIMFDECAIKISEEEWEKQDLLRHEQSVLGELVTGSVNDMFPGFFTGVGTTPISRLKILPDRHNIIVEFIVKNMLREFKIKSGKYKNRMMVKYRVADVDGAETELTVWPDRYEEAKKIMREGTPIRAQCQVSEFNGVKTLMLREIEKTQ